MVQDFLEKKDVNCLTFPGATWEYERDLAQNLPGVGFLFQGIEVDQKVFEKSWERAEALNQIIHNGTFFLTKCRRSLQQFLGHRDRPWNDIPFDLVYPDWMGTWNQDKKEDLRRMFVRRIFSQSAFLSITLMLGRGTNHTLSELHETVRHLETLTIEDLDLDERTERALKESQTGVLKVEGATAYIKALGRENGYVVDVLRLRIYDSLSSVREGYVCPQMRLLYHIRETTK